MSKFSVAMKRFGGFLKRNAFYLLIILCIASVATVIALAVTHNSSRGEGPDMSVDDQPTVNPDDGKDPVKPDDENTQPQKQPLTFKTPCNGAMTNDYCETMAWSQTLKQYCTHMGVDFSSDDLAVLAAADGKVTETGYDKLNGNYIVIEHEDGYISKYMSLAASDTVKVGATVKQGQQIGTMSNTQGREVSDGAHLHFELYKDGKQIDPIKVLILEEK